MGTHLSQFRSQGEALQVLPLSFQLLSSGGPSSAKVLLSTLGRSNNDPHLLLIHEPSSQHCPPILSLRPELDRGHSCSHPDSVFECPSVFTSHLVVQLAKHTYLELVF